MRKIEKGKEPKEWLEYRLTPGVDYQSIPALVSSLLKEQGCICAYCMRRIPHKDGSSNEDHRVEHIKCRERYPDLKLDYNNMLVCCPGAISGGDSTKFHCDKAKNKQDISFSPFSDELIESIGYKSDGTIESANDTWNKEICSVLNLNNELLKYNRKQVIDGFIAVLKASRKEINQKWFETQLESWGSKDKQGQLKPYCGVVEWYIRKKLKQYK